MFSFKSTMFCFFLIFHSRLRNRHGPVQQATSDHDEAYHPLSANLRCQTPSMHTGHVPAYVALQVSTHVYNEQQNKTASQGGNHVFEAKRIKNPAQQKPTTENGNERCIAPFYVQWIYTG